MMIGDGLQARQLRQARPAAAEPERQQGHAPFLLGEGDAAIIQRLHHCLGGGLTQGRFIRRGIAAAAAQQQGRD
ncbi:hypothetical protein MAIT1_04242 [Magnetofaba australis IT-1]|uniref:Uncharacterized protein n=1 Tax=Magnetofaba australis IT-1 TaxID=1434232 RepID=A0A1Y2K4P0_9PROT|nr:hypothetical protein MAIT1_04242 [Magnetofaba australis IT-1]